MRSTLTFLPALALVCASLPNPAHGAERLTLAARSDWALKAMDDRCRMARTFGAGDDEALVWLEKAGPGPFLNITLIGALFEKTEGPRITLAFAPGKAVARGFITSATSAGRQALSVFGVRPVTAAPGETGAQQTARLEAVQTIEVSDAIGRTITLETGSMAGIMQQLRECTDALPARQAQLPRREPLAPSDPPLTGSQRVATDYPRQLGKERAEGAASVRVQVAPEGRATFCEVVAYKGHPDFGNEACRTILGNARFASATDNDGHPVWGSFTTEITYKLD